MLIEKVKSGGLADRICGCSGTEKELVFNHIKSDLFNAMNLFNVSQVTVGRRNVTFHWLLQLKS